METARSRPARSLILSLSNSRTTQKELSAKLSPTHCFAMSGAPARDRSVHELTTPVLRLLWPLQSWNDKFLPDQITAARDLASRANISICDVEDTRCYPPVLNSERRKTLIISVLTGSADVRCRSALLAGASDLSKSFLRHHRS